jgi:hypothetical protein
MANSQAASGKQIVVIEHVGDEGSAFILKRQNSVTGKVSDAETYHSNKALKGSEVGIALMQDVKGQGTLRDARLTMLGHVLANPKMDAYKGKGDPKQAKLPDMMKKTVLECEAEFLRKLLTEGSIKVPVGKDENPEQKFQKFATAVREDKNYSNVKGTALRYFAFCNANVVTKSGYIIPVPVMVAEVNRILEQFKEPEDTSIAAQIADILKTMEAIKDFPADEAAKALPKAQLLAATLKGIIEHYAELATHARGLDGSAGLPSDGGVIGAAAAAVSKASESVKPAKPAKVKEAASAT